MKFCVWMKVSAQKYPNKTISVLQLKVFFCRKYCILANWRCWSQASKNSKIRYFQCQSSFYLHEALYQLRFTSLKTKLPPNISKLCLNRKTIFSKKKISNFLHSQRFLYLMAVKLPKVGNSLLEEMNWQRNYIVSKSTCFQQIFMGAEKKSKEFFQR